MMLGGGASAIQSAGTEAPPSPCPSTHQCHSLLARHDGQRRRRPRLMQGPTVGQKKLPPTVSVGVKDVGCDCGASDTCPGGRVGCRPAAPAEQHVSTRRPEDLLLGSGTGRRRCWGVGRRCLERCLKPTGHCESTCRARWCTTVPIYLKHKGPAPQVAPLTHWACCSGAPSESVVCDNRRRQGWRRGLSHTTDPDGAQLSRSFW
jgi:hypothetical protein